MIGIIFFGLMSIWLFVAIFLTKKISEFLPKKWWKSPLCLLIWFVVFTLPVFDEVVGGFQFRKICNSELYFEINAREISGKKVTSTVEKKIIQNFPVQIILKKFSYRDLESNKELASFTRYEAEGGWLARLIEFNTKNPWTFNGVCDSSPQTNFNFEIVRK